MSRIPLTLQSPVRELLQFVSIAILKPQLTDAVDLGTLNQEVWIVDSLSTGQDFFASHKHVVRVGVLRVMWVRHGVERTNCQRIFVLK